MACLAPSSYCRYSTLAHGVKHGASPIPELRCGDTLYFKMASQREALLHAAANFCNAFACQYAVEAILDHFSTSSEPFAIEHGLPQLAPFLGRPFRGVDGVKEYFGLLGQYLSYKDMRFVDYVVDVETAKVSARGTATFTWTKTKQSWDEVFTYVLGFDESRKVKSYEVWADSGGKSRRDMDVSSNDDV